MAEGCGPQVRELGLRGAGNHVVRPLLAQTGGRRMASPLLYILTHTLSLIVVNIIAEY